MKNFTKTLFFTGMTLFLGASTTLAQYGCGSAVVLSNGYTATGITTPGTGGAEDWNVNPMGTSINASYWDDDVYLFEYTAGGSAEQITMTINTYNSWNGIGIFDDCTGTTFSNELDASGSSSSTGLQTVSAVVAAGNTVYIAVGQWGTPNDLNFDVVQFSTVSCFTPSAGMAANITASSADISWTENGSATSWNIEYGVAGFTPTGTPTIAGTSNNPEPLTGLMSATDYEFYVQADCGGMDLSSWAGPYSFSTLCGALTPVYSQDFASYLPNCWDEATGALTASSVLSLSASDWGDDGFGNVGFTGAARVNIYSSGQFEWLISPSIDLTGGPFQLKYDVALTAYASTSSTTFDSDDSLVVVISTDNGATWSNANILRTYTTGTEPSNTGDLAIIDLSGYSGVVRIGFYATSSVSGADNDIFIDNVIVEPIPLCQQVSGINSSNLTATSVDLGWIENGSATAWNIEYGAAGFTPTGTPTIAGTSNNPESITGLSANSSYEFYVQADCSGNGTSIWTGPFTVTTTCGVYTPDYSEDFTNYVPSCWEEATGTLTASSVLTIEPSSWVSDGFANNGSTGAARMNIYSTGQDEWLISPSIDLTGGPFQLEYDVALTTYAGTSATTLDADDSLAVVISTDNGATWSNTNLIQVYTVGSEPSNIGQHEYIDLSAYSGVVKFGFYAVSTQNLVVDNDVSIDNFLVTALCLPTTGTDVQTACDSYIWIDGNTYTASNNTATFILADANVNGCDSIVTLDLTINYSSTVTDVQTACGPYTWIDGNTYTTSNNTATFVTTNAAGCDSIITLDLTVGAPNTGTDVQTVCGSYTWIDGNTYTASNNTATFVVMNASGCDSTVTLDLTILPVATGTDVQTACGSYTWIDGNTYTASNNTATFTVVAGAVNGCDSIVTLDLTILPVATSTDVQVACDTYSWIDGNTYTASNNTATFTVVGGATNGCDSIVTLDLTINNAVTTTDVQTACDSLVWNGTTYTTSGMYTWVGSTTTGCDSTVTLDVTINNSVSSTELETACDSLVWNGTTYTTSGMYTWVGTTTTGCDSTITLDLTINNSTSGTDVQTACDSFTWIDGNTYTASNNTATYTLTNAAGCDSIVTLDLTINTVDASVTNNDPSIIANATGATYVWLDCDNGNAPITGETGQTFTATANGNYAVEVTENGCVDTSACTPIVTVSLDNLGAFTGVAVYPNPVKNMVNVEMGSLESATIRLMDLNGKVLFVEEHVVNSLYTFEMNQEPGVYFIEVSANDTVKQFKVVKE